MKGSNAAAPALPAAPVRAAVQRPSL